MARDERAAALAAREVRLLALDVDGVLTDGGLVYDAAGQVSKRFHVRDGFGLKLAQAAGLDIAVISGLNHGAVAARMRELGVEEYHGGHNRKVPLLAEILARKGLEWRQVAFLGDDWVDAAALRRVGLPMAVADADDRVQALALWVAGLGGGQGAVRQAIDFILAAQGRLDQEWRAWLD